MTFWGLFGVVSHCREDNDMNKWFNGAACILLDIRDRVASITLNRPDKKNALSLAMLGDLRAALLEADDRKDVGVVVLQAAGTDFCSGYDLASTYEQRAAEGAARAAGDVAPAYRGGLGGGIDDDTWRIERYQQLLRTLFDIHKPVIAKVHGRCLAGGMDMAMYCDLVVAADNARIGFPAARANGTPPNQMWLYHMGPQWTKRLLFTGDLLSGIDAARLGLVMDAVPHEQLDAEVAELARRIALVDNDLLSAHKRIVNLGMELAGAGTLARLGAEMDARAHQSQGPRAQRFQQDVTAQGWKQAVLNRDEGFGDGMVTLHARGAS